VPDHGVVHPITDDSGVHDVGENRHRPNFVTLSGGPRRNQPENPPGNTAGLNLTAAGLAGQRRGGLKVDERYCTAIQHIYAAA